MTDMKSLVGATLRERLHIEPHRFMSHTFAYHLAQLLRFHEVNCVIDVGANVGQYGELLRNIGYRGRIVSFEPVEAPFAALRARRPRDEQWVKLRSALGAEDGAKEINVFGSSELSSFHDPAFDRVAWEHAGSSLVERTETVPMARLDSVIDRCVEGVPVPRVHLKLDTQGWDLEVLKGATRSLEIVETLQSELSVLPIYQGMTPWRDALSAYESLGFDLTGLFPVSLDDRLRVIEFDATMSRDRSPLSKRLGEL